MLQGLDAPIEFAEVTNAAATLDILRERAFHCAFLDLEGSEPGAIWVLKSAAAQGISTPVVMLVGDHDAQARSDAMDAGAAACLKRPNLSTEGLSKTLRCLVRLHRAEVKADQFSEVLEFQRRGLMMVFDATRMACHDLRGSLSTIMTTTTLLRHKIHKLTSGPARRHHSIRWRRWSGDWRATLGALAKCRRARSVRRHPAPSITRHTEIWRQFPYRFRIDRNRFFGLHS